MRYRDRVEHERTQARLKEAQEAALMAAAPAAANIPLPFPVTTIPDNRWVDMATALFVHRHCDSFEECMDVADNCRKKVIARAQEERRQFAAAAQGDPQANGLILPAQ